MIGLLGKKVGMTRIFEEGGRQIGVTVLQVGPCYVTGVKTPDRDGYSAVQIGFDEVRKKKVNRPKQGQLNKAGAPLLRHLREIRTDNVEGIAAGLQLTVDNFEAGDFVDVQGVSIGKGFQGVVKRHNFKGGESAHGSKFGREPGSTGQSATPARVIKGRGMPGQMGSELVTVQNLKVVKVDQENNLLVVEGAVPGASDECVLIKMSLKRGSDRGWKVPQPPEPEQEQKQEEASGDDAQEAEKPEEKTSEGPSEEKSSEEKSE